MYQSIKLSIYSIPKILTIPTEKRLLPFFPLINQTNIKKFHFTGIFSLNADIRELS